MLKEWLIEQRRYLEIKAQLKNLLKDPSPASPTKEEDNLLREIRNQTKANNKNNVTRTKAYLDFFVQHQEVHWALLAHLVSRNAGWNMTDLKGEFLPKLLSPKEQIDFYLFLERGNWLIFQDAYPQLLLYEASKKKKEPLFHLLPQLNVSRFMKPFWEHFWVHKSSSILTTALIINEQNYIETRVIQNSQSQQNVLDTVLFKLQDLFDLNHILIPYNTVQKKTRLIGGTVHHFSSLKKRILLGKYLYLDLYCIKIRLDQVINWAKMHPHTGSRHDFWPQLFNEVKDSLPYPDKILPYTPEHHKSSPRIYSPKLSDVWEDWVHASAEEGDWFKNMKMWPFIKKNSPQKEVKIREQYWHTIEKLEIAAYAKNLFTPHHS